MTQQLKQFTTRLQELRDKYSKEKDLPLDPRPYYPRNVRTQEHDVDGNRYEFIFASDYNLRHYITNPILVFGPRSQYEQDRSVYLDAFS